MAVPDDLLVGATVGYLRRVGELAMQPDDQAALGDSDGRVDLDYGSLALRHDGAVFVMTYASKCSLINDH